MAESIICRGCGARIKLGRERCLRCGSQLASAAEPTSAHLWSRLGVKPGLASLTGIALSLVALLTVVGVVYLPARPSSAKPAPISRPSPKADAAPPVQPARPAIEPQFLDHRTAGTVAYAHGDYGSAAEGYRKAIASNPNDADALNNLGQVLTRVGNAAEAIPYFERALTLYPNVWTYRFNLARAHGQMGDWTRAVAGYRAAEAMFPDDYVTQFNLAHALHKQGQEADAVVAYQKAIVLAPGEPTFHLSLAVSYENLGRSNEAVQSYRRYLEMAPDAAEAQQVRDRIQALTTTTSRNQETRSLVPPLAQ